MIEGIKKKSEIAELCLIYKCCCFEALRVYGCTKYVFWQVLK